MKNKRIQMLGLWLITFLTTVSSGFANAINIDSGPRIRNVNLVSGFAEIQFDITWQNSWRTATGPSNWDAAWVFFKFREGGAGEWRHAWLSTNNTHHSVGVNNGVAATIETGTTTISSTARGMGVFMYRTNNGTGTNNWDNVAFRWQFRDQGISDLAQVELQAFALEMVYIPQGTFSVGSGGANQNGGNNNESGSFTNGSWAGGAAATIPFSISSEAAITIGNTAGNLWGSSTSGTNTIGAAGTLAASFPKGFAPFYLMKYELTQAQFAGFFNTLNYNQQRWVSFNVLPNAAVGTQIMSTDAAVLGVSRMGVRIMVQGQPDVFGNSSTLPCIVGVDGDNDGIFNEANEDGLEIAMMAVNDVDMLSFSDWAGLRPFTELEYEKAVRGTAAPVANEYPWGNATAAPGTTSSFNNLRALNETVVHNNANNFVNAFPTSGNGQVARVGFLATGSTTRTQAGAGFYGNMELAGNAAEYIISVGLADGRLFTGTHGDGLLSVDGQYNVSGIPAPVRLGGGNNRYGSNAIGRRGGACNVNTRRSHLFTSSRINASNSNNNTNKNIEGGIRCARTAP